MNKRTKTKKEGHVVYGREYVGVAMNVMSVMKTVEVSEESPDDDDDAQPLSIHHLYWGQLQSRLRGVM